LNIKRKFDFIRRTDQKMININKKELALFWENLRIATRSVRSNLLRSILTILIIAFGIMALVGILTAIESIKSTINSEFSRMGANSFMIESRSVQIHIGNQRNRVINNSQITYDESTRFKNDFNFPALVSIMVRASGNSTVKYKSVKTNPNIPVIGTDENYIFTSGLEIEKGRNFTFQDVNSMKNFVIIGSQLSTKLFGTDNPLDEIVNIGDGKYRVIGVLKEKGSSMGNNIDQICVLPVTSVRLYFSQPNMMYRITVLPNSAQLVDIALSEAEGLFRQIRKLGLADENDFNLNKSDNLAKMLIDNIKYVTLAATIIGVITLLGAAIGLMNIMLVSVSERTREIGTRKAIGANSKMIRRQFLYESVMIGQMGGLLGIILGILIGNLVSVLMGSSFIVPWLWILGGILVCLLVGVLSGLLPAIRAARLDPIMALRYE